MSRWILVVEDDDAIADAVEEILRDEGLSVVRAADGRQALRLVAAEPAPSLILLDLLMPGLDGKGFLRQRGTAYPASIPIAVFTAVREIQFSAGPAPPVEAVLAKPCDVRLLIETVRSLLRRDRDTRITEPLRPVV